MPSLKLCLAGAALICANAAAPVQAAAYLDTTSWAQALSDAQDQYGAIAEAASPAYQTTVQDSYGTWTAETRFDPVPVGVNNPPYTNPDATASRPATVFPNNSAGQISGNFGCHSFVRQCLGALQVTITLPYEIIGFSGTLSVAALPLYDTSNFLPELEIGGYLDSLAWARPGATTFYGQLFDAPTNSFTVSWFDPLPSSFDALGRFSIGNAQVVTAVPVPEPASMALFATGLIGLAGLAGLTPRRRS
jgi:hypothetical protein